jgi:hypothetical protein
VNEDAKDASEDVAVDREAGSVPVAGTAAASDAGNEVVDESQDAVSVEAGVRQQEVPEAATTGESAVDDALARLRQIGESPTADHVEIYDDVHRRLTDALADVDED